MLLIIHSITSVEMNKKKMGISLDHFLCCFLRKKKGHTRKKNEQEYACRQKDVCVENK
jgi:hypothetical protein